MTELSWTTLLIAILGSAVAGAINTLAGNGSAITLTILTEMIGLPGNVANATNRVGVWAQTTAGGFAFHREGRLKLGGNQPLVYGTIAGAVLGVGLALIVSNEQFMSVFRYLLVLMLAVILIKPKRWLKESNQRKTVSPWISWPLYILIGIYGGFIQMGMGIVFLAASVLVSGYNLIDANVLKAVIVAVYTTLVLAIFAYKGLIDWRIGGLMAIGQIIGGYATAIFAVRFPKADVWAHRLMIIVVIAAIWRTFDVSAWFVN